MMKINKRTFLAVLVIATEISPITLLHRLKNEGYSTVTGQLDKLCTFFECEIHELVKFVPDNQLNAEVIAA